jgi:hypothetical protein
MSRPGLWVPDAIEARLRDTRLRLLLRCRLPPAWISCWWSRNVSR